jgi:exocyst complex component 4
LPQLTTQPDQRLQSEAHEPDPDVIDLNSALMDMDDIGTRTLADADKNFMFRGLATLIDFLFVNAARDIKLINEAGVHKIQRNILSLQQTLRGIIAADAEGMLLRATEFWAMYEPGPKVRESTEELNPSV